jgi:hypothetical protein
MLPEDGTVDAIFRVVKALNERQRKTWKERLKSSYSSLHDL